MSELKSNDYAVVYPSDSIGGDIAVSGDKSISHRTAMFAALSNGRSKINGFLQSEDCLATLSAMEHLGARVDIVGDDEISVVGTAGKFSSPSGDLDMGNSGTGMRLLAGLLSGFDIEAVLVGDESLSSRPMNRIKHPLDLMGARIELLGENGRPPIRVRGSSLQGIVYELPMASAQVKSAVLMAGAMAEGRTTVVEPRATRDHTERVMTALGLPISVDGLEINIDGSGGSALEFPARDWQVPGDFSSASFWMVAAAASPGAALRLRGVGLNPRRTAFMDVLRRMGASIEVRNELISDAGELYGDLLVAGGALSGTEVGGDEIPNLIDECPILAVAGALADGRTVITDAAELRVKESDRIAVMCANLRDCGVAVEEREDGMVVQGSRANIRGGCTVRSHGDHRIAMAAGILAAFARDPITIEGIDCIQTSYPDFWRHMGQVGIKFKRSSK